MAETRRWIATSAASVLGIGVLATGAVGVANAMPLVDTTTSVGVEPITTVAEPGKAFSLNSDDALREPLPTSSAQPVTPATPASASTSGGSTSSGTSSPNPVPNPSPVTVSPASPVTPPSPASVASVDSAASAESAD